MITKADKYYSIECIPEVISVEPCYEGMDESGAMYSYNYTYNCEGCGSKECEYWSKYNDVE